MFEYDVHFNGRFAGSERIPNTCNVSVVGPGLQGKAIQILFYVSQTNRSWKLTRVIEMEKINKGCGLANRELHHSTDNQLFCSVENTCTN